jgi:hypothetical protein
VLTVWVGLTDPAGRLGFWPAQVGWAETSGLWPNHAWVLLAPVASELDTSSDLFSVLAMRVCGGRGVCASPVEAPSAMLPVLHDEDLPR